MIRGAIETVPPTVVASSRLWVGALVLYVIMRQAGRRLPPFFIRTHNKGRIRRAWIWMIAIGVIGNTLPFFIFPWAQQYVDSGLAGVYMAFMPIWTIALAFFFAGETLNGRKLVGFALGFVGVIILMGPEVLKGAVDSDLRAQGGLLLATLLYAIAVVLTRLAPPIRPRVFAAGMMLVAAISSTPALLFSTININDWSATSIASIIGLGVFPTGLNGVLIIMLVRRVGAGFMALTNYFTPLWAVAIGALIYHERLEPGAFLALGVILLGVAISQRKGRLNPSPAIEPVAVADQTKS